LFVVALLLLVEALLVFIFVDEAAKARVSRPRVAEAKLLGPIVARGGG